MFTMTREALDRAAEFPDEEDEAQLEEIAFQAANGAYDEAGTQAVVKALWYAFVRRQRFMD